MEYAIQRRGIFLAPPDQARDLKWLFAQFDEQFVWEMFGFSGPSGLRLARSYRLGTVVIGVLHTVTPIKRIGFVVMFAPTPDLDFWEFGYAIPDPVDRDAFSALNATDAMAHYMFEHLNVDAMGWRTHANNRAADAVVRRLGYTPYETRDMGDAHYTFYRLTREGWFKRRERLDRGEAAHPSGTGETFVTLMTKPWAPIPVAARAEQPAAPAPADASPSPAVKTKAAPKKARAGAKAASKAKAKPGAKASSARKAAPRKRPR